MHTSFTLFLAALGAGQALAGLSHARFHQHRHARREAQAPGAGGSPDWKAMNWKGMFSEEQWADYYAAGQKSSAAAAAPIVAPTSAPAPAPPASSAAPATSAAAPVAAPASSPAASPAVSPASSANTPSASPANVGASLNGVLSGALSQFSNIKAVANGNTQLQNIANPQTGTSDGTLGNYGAPNCMNMMQVTSIDNQDFTSTVVNNSEEDLLLVWWNNSFGGVPNNGQCLASSTPCLSIPVTHGETVHVAFGDWSIGGMSIATKDISSCGMFNQAMIEHHFASTGGGYDYSSIPVTNGKLANMVVTSSESSCVSSQTENSWKNQNNDPSQPVPIGSSDGSCYVPGKTTHLTVTISPF